MKQCWIQYIEKIRKNPPVICLSPLPSASCLFLCAAGRAYWRYRGGGGCGRGAESCHGEKALSSISHSILSGFLPIFNPHPRIHLQRIFNNLICLNTYFLCGIPINFLSFSTVCTSDFLYCYNTLLYFTLHATHVPKPTVLGRGWDWAQYYWLSLHWLSKLLPTKLFPKQGYHLQTRLHLIVEHLIHHLGQQKETSRGKTVYTYCWADINFAPPPQYSLAITFKLKESWLFFYDVCNIAVVPNEDLHSGSLRRSFLQICFHFSF